MHPGGSYSHVLPVVDEACRIEQRGRTLQMIEERGRSNSGHQLRASTRSPVRTVLNSPLQTSRLSSNPSWTKGAWLRSVKLSTTIFVIGLEIQVPMNGRPMRRIRHEAEIRIVSGSARDALPSRSQEIMSFDERIGPRLRCPGHRALPCGLEAQAPVQSRVSP